MRRKSFVNYTFFFIPSTTITLDPLKDPRICGRPVCADTNAKFRYNVGSLYKFDYSMYVKTALSGSGDNTSELHLSSVVEIDFHAPCQATLKMYTIEVRERAQQPAEESDADYGDDYNNAPDLSDTSGDLHPKSELIADELMRFDLRFAFHDGAISEICHEEDEPVWTLNLKRGILSALQNTMPRFDIDYETTETDVSGICDVSYKATGRNGTSLLFRKSKDIVSCKRRYKTISLIQTVPYDFRLNYVAWPILNSTSYCDIAVDNSIYKNVACYERHQLVPFSNGLAGAVTETATKLELTDEDTYTDEGQQKEEIDIQRRSTLLYDHTPSLRDSHDEIKASRELLKQLCALGFPNIKRDFPDVFLSFLTAARGLSTNALYQLLARSGSICDNGRNHILESLPYIGSPASVSLMKDQILKGEVSSALAREWMRSFAYLTRPNEEVLEAMFELIEHGSTIGDQLYFLPATTVVHTFCNIHPEDCGELESVQRIVDFLGSKLSDSLADEEELEQDRSKRASVILLLKSLSNMGVVNKPLTHELRAVIEDERKPVEVRVEAVNVFRRHDCLRTKDYFLKVYGTFQLDVEVRIAAYLQAMRCPDYLSVKLIKHVLKTEEVNQVGSFVWSHLTNLAGSASPVRVEAQGLLAENDLGKKFRLDVRKFSRNYEQTLFFDEYNFGMTVDSNVIFSTESYLPRTVRLNLTTDLFGESINFLELNIRSEGFEDAVQAIFGPHGSFSAKMVNEQLVKLLKLARQYVPQRLLDLFEDDPMWSDESESEDGRKRKRDTQRLPAVFAREVQEEAEQLGYRLKSNFSDPQLTISGKIFGNEMFYFTMGKEILQRDLKWAVVKKLFSGKEVSYTKSGVFLDTSYDVPLSSGLPLALGIVGASSVDLRMTGAARTFDIWRKMVDVEGKVKPSVTVDLTATMRSDFVHASTAIKVKSNLYSSSAWETKLKVRGADLAVLTVSLPQDRNEIFSVRSEMFVLADGRELKQTGIERRYSNSTCTWPFIDQAIGLKVCANYSLPDVSSGSEVDVPSLILSGPVNFDFSLDKADLTAKVYLLKYSWDARANQSIGTIVFETPHSLVPRVFRANITLEAHRKTAIMSFVNGNISHKAVGMYVHNADQHRLEMSLNVNDRKYLALEMGYNKTVARNGRLYHPSFYLSVNNERIAGMGGQVRQTEKNNITQWDYTMVFETKRLRAKAIGYVAISYNATYMIHNSMEYRFSASKLEHLVINAMAEAVKKDVSTYNVNFDLRSSAYPHFDVALNATYLEGTGRCDFTLLHNNAPDLRNEAYRTTIKVIFAHDNPYRSQVILGPPNDNPTERTSLSFEVTRPRSKTDLKAMIVHENMLKKGLEHNVRLLVRYAPKREVTGVVSFFIPRTQLFWFDGAFNLTVPGFHPCTVQIRIKEKALKEHSFDFRGVWFSAHALNVSGWYKDRSSIVKSYHHAKLVAQTGPTFREVLGDLKYIRDENDNRLDVRAMYDKRPYGITLHHRQGPENGTSSYAELRWNDGLYWFSALMKSAPIKQLDLELHIDKIRDVSVSLRGYSTTLKREVGIELKWDANRDPTQRITISGELNTPTDRMYDGLFLLSYPNRTFSGTFDLKLVDPRYLANARISWNTTEAIELRLDAGTDDDVLRNMWLLFQLNTPFHGWRHNALNGGFYFKNNLLRTNLSAHWAEDQNLGLALMGYYMSNETDFNCELETKLHSSIQHVPTAMLHLKHKTDRKRIETICTVNHTVTDEPPQVFSVRSNWQYDADRRYRNVTGSLKMISPFDGYQTGALVAKVSLSESRAITGAADLQLDDDKYEMVVVGHVRNLVDCMLTANVTSSNENYRNINGRFGISEKDRHLVAEVITPKSALGVEILYAIVSSQNFDVKFHLATPLKDLEKVILRGKLQPDNIDFRVGMNSIVLGCTGVWRKATLRDFEYSYRIYTPLPKFEESALIVKLVINTERSEYIDVELSGKFSEYKLGLKAVSKPKPRLIRQLLPQTASSMVEEDPWSAEESDGNDDGEDEEEYEDEEDEQELLNFIGDIELYTIVLPTIEGTLELTEHRSQYRAIGKIKLPQGDIDIRDRFYLKDLLNMQNKLRLKTPFPVAKEITSEFVLKYSYQATDITVGMNVKFNNRSEWVNTGFQVNYKYHLDEAEVHKHQALVDLMTPMKNLQKVFLNGSLELEDHSYKGNLTAKTMTTDASLALSFESEDQFIDTFMSVWVRAPLMPYYACRVFYKQDFSNTENSMDLGFLVNDGDMYSNFRIDGVWSFASPHYLVGAGKYQSNFLPINLINTELKITRSPHPKAYWNVRFNDQNGTTEEIRASAERNREMFTIELSVPMEAYKNLSIHGRLQNRRGSEYTVSGQLYRNEYVFQLEGDATIVEDIPYRAELKFQPLGAEGSDGTISYRCGQQKSVTDFNLKLESGSKLAKLDGSFKLSAMSDWYIKLGVESSEPSLKDIDFSVGIEPKADAKALGKFNLRSPWAQYGIDRADIELMFDVKPISGSVVGRYAIRELTGNSSCLWNWALKSDMQFALENRVVRNSVERYFRTGVRYISPDVENNHNFTFGGDLNLNNIWVFNANASVDFISIRDLSAVMTVLLPKPVGDVHTLAIAMNGNLPFVEPVKSFNLETSYETEESRKRYAYHSEYSFIGDLRTLLRFEWGPDIRKQRIQSNLNMFRIGDRRELTARLRGPWYLEDAFTAYGTYDYIDALFLVSGNISIPASTKVASANVAFNNLSNMKGDVNCTTPFLNVTWLHGQLEFIETPLESIRYLKGTWPESSAVFDAKATYRSHNQDREQQGTIKIEVPLQTRHYAEVKYGLAQRPAITTGHAEVDYNSQKVLSGQYTSKEESRAGFDKETIDVTLENNFMPVGVHYVHSLNLLDADVRTLDIKRAEVFQLRNQKNFNITGELHVLNKAMGREYIVKAIHPNRTVVLTADFEKDNNINRKKSKLQLSPTVWIAYDFQLVNRSRDDLESQNFTLQISYPKRNISADGWYSYTDLAFDSDLTLSYSPNRTDEDSAPPKERTVRGAIVWRDLLNSTTGGQQLQLALGHPSFKQDVTLDALYFTNPKHWFSSNLALRYNDDDDHLLAMGFDLNDMRPIVGYWNYSYHLYSRHSASDLDLDSIGSVGLRHGLYGISSNSHYQRAYLSQMQGHVLGSLNIQEKELHYERITSQSKYRIWTKAAGAYPIYKINGTLLDGTEVDANGFFYLNIDDRMVQMKINMTPDGSENVYMYGIIPDSRSAYFDFWRDYDNSREVDVTYYLKMNHSRLITGHMLWRPQIKSDLQEWVKDYFSRMHHTFLEYTEFWIKHVYLETKDSTTGIYEAALPYVEGLLEDMAGLSVLQNDLEDLHHFLNASYVADDFYIRSAINFTITVLDELAIKNKITSLPKILTELWQVMGESGQALGKSIAWLLERVKQSYQKFMDIVGRIFQGDAMRYLSSTLEDSLERYDRFVKDIHLQFIKNIQEMWEKCTTMASTFWHRMLQNIEPTIIRLAHYGESLGWFVGNEIFSFLYNKTQELADSPYFNTVTNFTQDLDMLYKDLVTNDVFTNLKKYSSVTYRFLREKYFQLVPFGREFHQVVMELVEEIKQLQKIEYVRFFIQRYEEVRAKMEWLADEFQVERRLQQMWVILRNKLSHIAQTALQAENHYREAKTKFIFDPDHGVMELEQKLPMSWHAFNETPKFEEIPEFKFIGDIQDLFAGSNTTLWTLYNDICPFADPQMWLPPFKSVGLLVGSRHYMSFDKRFISMDLREMEQGGTSNECRYVLAHDYHNRTLTLLLEPSVLPDGRSSRKITLITDDHTLEIDIFDVSVKINKKDTTALPALIGKETVVYRESDLLYVHSQRGFLLACSLRYHLCWLELSGWYFGKVAGLLGTMNNEPFDDRTTALQRFSQSDDHFLNSWALPGCRASVGTTNRTSNYYGASNELTQLCDSFFRHKLSYFASCFPVVDVTPFYDMCLDLGHHLKTDAGPSDRGACSAALAYIQACAIEDTLLRVPDSCISCQLLNGTHVPEGSFVPLRDADVPAAADVVFIVEAKPCNERFVQTKSINLLVDSINRELQELKIRDTRYGVVAFGGAAPFDRAHSVVVGNSVFEKHDRLQPFFEHIVMGNGTNEDIFDAIILASKLVFRPGASKTFILLPCSRCATSKMKLDFSSIVQLLIEYDIKLHILADHELSFNKTRVSRLFYGMDSRAAYTKKDVKELVGDEELRKQIRLPKATLGECIALAMETNGSVFGGHKLRQDHRAANTNNTKKFIKVFAKRIAQTAVPNSCQTCECTGHNTGVAYMQCLPCEYPSPFTLDDDDMTDEKFLSVMQPENDWAWDEEDEQLMQ
ncbi:AGAP008807-PA-like protein [Anopheles sinensis]|uniref:AGAP008807-PA-like protein n=1 Tax=Anopheles sinensis TaxID=74873 RepID=A0A084VJ90_ANOSI|nr:AGAP008807-PA-like protein [Anopheles sinensis]